MTVRSDIIVILRGLGVADVMSAQEIHLAGGGAAAWSATDVRSQLCNMHDDGEIERVGTRGHYRYRMAAAANFGPHNPPPPPLWMRVTP